MPRILVVGNATFDIVNVVDHYPAEDEELRAVAQRRAGGGNAANTAKVLAQRGHQCRWLGTLGDDADADCIIAELTGFGVDCSAAVRVAGGRSPVSYVILNQATGSRTIVHHRDLPELQPPALDGVDLTGLDWVHFEGRNVTCLPDMLERVRARAPGATVSVEMEKARPGIEALPAHADVVLFSRAFAAATGHGDAPALLRHWSAAAGTRPLVCTWGEQGAWALAEGRLHHVPAAAPSTVVDTLGAGDTFNAGIIDARLRGLDWPAALERAVRLAGRKCAQAGFDRLGDP